MIILFLTLTPSTGGEVFWLLKIKGMDKVAHFGLFFVLSLFSYTALKNNSKRNVWIIIISLIYGLLFAFLTEFGQQFVKGRSSDLMDFMADMLGVICGIVISKIILSKYITA